MITHIILNHCPFCLPPTPLWFGGITQIESHTQKHMYAEFNYCWNRKTISFSYSVWIFTIPAECNSKLGNTHTQTHTIKADFLLGLPSYYSVQQCSNRIIFIVLLSVSLVNYLPPNRTVDKRKSATKARRRLCSSPCCKPIIISS